jgi:hypothetical protein
MFGREKVRDRPEVERRARIAIEARLSGGRTAQDSLDGKRMRPNDKPLAHWSYIARFVFI